MLMLKKMLLVVQFESFLPRPKNSPLIQTVQTRTSWSRQINSLARSKCRPSYSPF
ncbi:hypothetical protein LINGRAHAP2_LOCUS22522 [Linum grandiflorum]